MFRHIEGSIINNTNEPLDYVEIKFGLFDAAGNQVDSTFTNITGLQPHAVWKFDTAVTADGATSARVIDMIPH